MITKGKTLWINSFIWFSKQCVAPTKTTSTPSQVKSTLVRQGSPTSHWLVSKGRPALIMTT